MGEFNIEYTRPITVVYADENLVEFDGVWVVEGDLLKDLNDGTHDIEIKRQEGSNNKRFTYLGTAKVGEKYYVDSNKNSLPEDSQGE